MTIESLATFNPLVPTALAGLGATMLFAAAVILLVFARQMTLTATGVLVSNHIALEILFYSLLATLLGAPVARRGCPRAEPVFDRAATTLPRCRGPLASGC